MSRFSVRKDTADLVYELEEDGNGLPAKLGDGSFGIVLKVRMLQNVPGALKLFYQNERDNMRARRTFEMTLRDHVIEKQKQSGAVVDTSGLLLPEGTCIKFCESDAFQKHSSYFEAAGIELSGDGVVMSYFDCTLKDLLERGAPAGRLCGGKVVRERSDSGYAILSKLGSAAREATILPILRQIALGLQALHAFALHHHDLKPANVLVKSEGGNIRVALGDFGFADPNMNQSTLVDLNDEAMAFGTRHYRSVEQKDYFDVCEADVFVEDEAGRPLSIRLETQDAKFYDSIIEPGDLCIFRKDSRRTGWPIESIERKKNDSSFATTIRLQPVENARGIVSDKKTQVAFLKKQTHRTDLFGFGAIAFDMLTAGKSPERFYDLLRPYDRVYDDVQESQIASIEATYQKFVRSPSVEPRYRVLFNELKTGSTFPSPKFVAMLLRCMLSTPKDSFYKAHPSTDGAFQALVDSIDDLVKQHDAFMYLADKANPLWNGGDDTPKTTAASIGFTETLKRHRADLQQSPGALTLSHGYRLLRTLNSTIKELISRHRTKRSYFTPCDPAHLNADGSFDESSVAFASETTFFDALRSGEAVTLRDEIEGNNFLPPFMRHRTRSAIVSATSKGAAQGMPNTEYTLTYSESVPSWECIEEGDFLRVTAETGPIHVFGITKSDEMHVQLQPLPPRTASGQKPVSLPAEFKGEVIKRIDAVDYYLCVFGIYIHQLFFVTDSRVFEPIPRTVWLLEEAGSAGALDWETLRDQCKSEKPTRNESIASIQKEAAKLYTWLIMRLYKRGEAKHAAASADLLAKVAARVRHLEEKIAAVLGQTDDWLQNATDEDINTVAATIDKESGGKKRQLDSVHRFLLEIVNSDCFKTSGGSPTWGFLAAAT